MDDILSILLPSTLGASFVLLVLFLVSWKHNKMSLLPGALFLALLGSLMTSYWLAVLDFWTQNVVAMAVFVVSVILLLLVSAYGLYALVVFFLINASVVRRRESRSLANSLTLIAAIAIVLFLAVSFLISQASPPPWLQVVWTGLLFPLGFYLLHAFCYLASLILCRLAKPSPNQDYIIVLGSGLIKGQTSPLLKRRIDRAIKFACKQRDRTGKCPHIIMSGGQGPDEPRSEAAAMAEYAQSCDWPTERTLLEQRSRNTLENMRFSRELMDAHFVAQRSASASRDGCQFDQTDEQVESHCASEAKASLLPVTTASEPSKETRRKGSPAKKPPYSCIFSTSSYHLLRAGMTARQAGLSIDGIGARSTWYFAPNAILREYIAYLAQHKRRVATIFAALFVLGVLLHSSYLVLYALYS
ncbi:MAG: YdcF family protein [Coriobacteriaceae bacterium]|nr:YdcF family protein [Coriobacteriaceae bacterium]